MKKGTKILDSIIPLIVAIFNLLILLFPKDIIEAAKEGSGLWFNNVLPSLLPFIIGTNILSGLGVTDFIGTLLEPVMYPLFRVPGCSGFALAVGMTSGYPIGAKVASDLKQSKLLTDNEAQRLAGFCNNSGPLFILGAIGVSMFKNPQVGYFILFIHYAAAITTGLILRFYKYEHKERIVRKKRILLAAMKNMKDAQRKDGRKIGELLGDSVRNAMETILYVGGFIILFCVIVRVLEITGITNIFVYYCRNLISYTGFSDELYKGLLVGFIEMTNGAKILSEGGFSKTGIILTASIVSFGGISIVAQSASFFSKCGIKVSVYILSKLLQAIITAAYGLLLYPFFNFENYTPVLNVLNGGFLDKIIYSLLYFGMTLLLIFVLVLISLLYKLKQRK